MNEKSDKVRINKYLADKGVATRREVDDLISAGKVLINGERAVLGQKVGPEDKVDVVEKKGGASQTPRRYLAYYKPKGYVTHSPTADEKEISSIFKMKDFFPIGRLDKNSEGLIILTNDGRITDRLLNPKYEHEKEYEVGTERALNETIKEKMEKGVDIGEGEITKPAKVELLDEHHFSITLTEGKRHQVKRMSEAVGFSVHDLKRTRIMNIKLGNLKQNTARDITGKELEKFLKDLGLGQ